MITKSNGRRAFLVSALVGGLLSLAPLPAHATTTNPPPVPVSLLNGWKSAGVTYQTGVPAAVLDGNGIVHLSGGIAKGASGTEAFVLPLADRPSSNLYINTYMFNTAQGYLVIETDGSVYPVGTGVTSYTDLAGISFPAATNSLSFTTSTGINGWSSADPTYGTGDPASAKDAEGIVHLSGSVEGGSSGTVAFVLPPANRPAHNLYLDIYTLDGSTGFVEITSTGNVYVSGSSAGGYASLAGITFRAGNSILQARGLVLENGWVAGGFSTAKPTVTRDGFGFVHLNGSVANSSSPSAAFVLPTADQPAHTLYLTTYAFGGADGTIKILTDGTVYLFGSASFISLDSITFEGGV